MRWKVSCRIHIERRSGTLALTVLCLAVATFVGLLAWTRSGASAAPPEPAAFRVAYPEMLKYYLTQVSYDGSQAEGVCANGYHMASLWEILDPSNVRYDTALGNSRADSGEGPPSFIPGWVRTGYNSNNGDVPGQANCSAWSTTSGYGTVVHLPSDWSDSALQKIGVWDAAFRACNSMAPVWCVEDPVEDPVDPGTCQLPIDLVCGQKVSGDTSGRVNQISTYDCFPAWTESGPETIYRFTLPPGGNYAVTAQLTDPPGDPDLDLFLLSSGGCAGGGCATSGSFGDNTVVVKSMSPGTYYAAVDGYNGAAGSYSLELSCVPNIYVPFVLRGYGR